MERERDIYIALGRRSRQRARYGHSGRARYGLAGEDSVSPQKWSLRSRSVHHGANSIGMKWMKCERRRREGSEKRESVAENFGREMKMKKEFATVITLA